MLRGYKLKNETKRPNPMSDTTFLQYPPKMSCDLIIICAHQETSAHILSRRRSSSKNTHDMLTFNVSAGAHAHTHISFYLCTTNIVCQHFESYLELRGRLAAPEAYQGGRQ